MCGLTVNFFQLLHMIENFLNKILGKKILRGLPTWLSGKESACQREDQEDHTCCEAAKPTCHNYGACALEPGHSNY